MDNTFHITVKGFSKADYVTQQEHEDCLAGYIKNAILDWIHCTNDSDVTVKPLRRM